MTDANNCTATDDVSVSVLHDDITSITEPVTVQILPNPFSTDAVIRIQNAFLLNSETQFVLFDVLGNSVMSTSVMNSETNINRSGISSGIYFYELRNDNKIIQTGKICITD